MTEVLRPPSPHDGPSYFSPAPLQRVSSASSFHLETPAYSPKRRPSPVREPQIQRPSTDEPSPYYSPGVSYLDLPPTPSFHSTPSSTLSLNVQPEEDEEICLPTYNDAAQPRKADRSTLEPPESSPTEPSNPASNSSYCKSTPTSGSPPSSPIFSLVVDDTALRDEPQRQVDYLSHDWREEDIWCSWRHIVSKRRIYGQTSRLENASWRTWAKAKYRLPTVTPETLNWLKDCDVTWLYGPLQESSGFHHASEPQSRLSKNNSFIDKKPILKKRSVSEIMLQKSLSSSSLIKQAATVVQAQRRGCPSLRKPKPDYPPSPIPTDPCSTTGLTSTLPSSLSSGLVTPDPNGVKHIRFDNKVEQCIAVDFRGDEVEDEEDVANDPIESSSEDDLVMMKTPMRRKPFTPGGSRRNSFDSRGIAKLPCTTLKFHNDEPPGQPVQQKLLGSWRPGKLNSSPSQETLRPTRPSANFLLDDDDDYADMSWEPSGAFGSTEWDGISGSDDPTPQMSSEEHNRQALGGMRRTPSGMFMPLEDEDEERFASTGILGRVVDTVNTARDIAHVIWNVGWRS